MTSPAVVILTEPANCELADASVILRAMQQVQQLSEAGVPVSQAFCDHPGDAMKFIDAYAKAYPDLQQQSSDLPLPEHLYSMIADGRLNPLQALDPTRENARLEAAAQLQPLYVLSLGKPEALMQALQHNGLVSGGIQVFEIPPAEDSRADPVSVAEAVAARPLASHSWLTESSSASRADDQGPLRLDASADAPLKLESVESDLDHIQIDGDSDRPQRTAQAAPIVDTAPSVAAREDASAERPVQDDARAASSGSVTDLSPQQASAAASVAEPTPEAREAARTEPDDADRSAGQIDDKYDSGLASPEKSADAGAEDQGPPAGDGAEDPNQPPEGTPPSGEPVPGAGASPNAPGTGPEIPGANDGTDDDASTGPTGDAHSFGDPGGDVLYPPTGSLASEEDDLLYPLPTGGVPEPGTLDHVLDLSLADDVVDLDAIGHHVPDLVDDPSARSDHLDPVLARPPEANDPSAHGLSGPQADDPATDYSDVPDADDGADHNGTPAILHDLDI